MQEKLFVYGTLGPGRSNAHILENIGGSFVPAYVKGYLKAEGWGAAMGFPGLVPDANGGPVHGFVFSSPACTITGQIWISLRAVLTAALPCPPFWMTAAKSACGLMLCSHPDRR